MKKKTQRKAHRQVHHFEQPIRWLPIDSRFITPLFKFGAVKGVARVFLELEITLSILIVVGTLIVAVIKVVSILMK